jgi:hypothetical protein
MPCANSILKFKWPCLDDPIVESLHNGRHCLFFDPAVSIHDIHNQQTLQDLCDWTNHSVAINGWEVFFDYEPYHGEIANLVKLNLWLHALRESGNIKPMLLTYTGGKFNSEFISGTGSSRLRVMERIPTMQTVTGFITTSCRFQEKFSHLELVTTFDRFAELCNAVPGQEFLFRLTDPTALFGIDWYEYDSYQTKQITPNDEACVIAMKNYINHNKDTVFSPEWFDKKIVWDYT